METTEETQPTSELPPEEPPTDEPNEALVSLVGENRAPKDVAGAMQPSVEPRGEKNPCAEEDTDTESGLAPEIDNTESTSRAYKVGQDQLGTLDICLLAQTVETEQTPSSWKQAIHVPQWMEAMKAEKSELEEKGAWKLVPRPQGTTILPGLWRYKVKRNENGDTVKYKWVERTL